MLLPLSLFGIAALGGLYMAVRILAGSGAPLALSLVHAALGAGGIVLLYLGISEGQVGGIGWLALVLFIVAALGGFYLASFRLGSAFPPKTVVAIHALVAVTAFALLAGLTFGFI